MPRHCILWILVAALAAAPLASSAAPNARPHARHTHQWDRAHKVRRVASRRVRHVQPVVRTSRVDDAQHAYVPSSDRPPTDVKFRVGQAGVVGSVGIHHRLEGRTPPPEPMSGPEPSRFDKPESAVGISLSRPF